MTTDEIMVLALKMAGFSRTPEDSAIFVAGRDIRKVLFGVDVGAAELMVAKDLGVDLVIAHHPTGVYIDQWKVLLRHVEFMTAAGVPEDAALGAVAERIEATKLRGQISNFDQTPSVARLLGMPFMNIHAPLDELGRRRIIETVNRALSRGNARVVDLVNALAALPEMAAAATTVQQKACFDHGVDTIVYIHIDYADLQHLRSEGRGNLIITGHLAGDGLGFTPFIAELRRRGLQVTTFSGVIDAAT